MFQACRRWGVCFSFLAVAASSIAATATAPAPAGGGVRKGWHGEAMPAGLERGHKSGEYVWRKDGSILVYVPPGPFTMGSDKGRDNEKPVHEVDLAGFYIDKYEVSWKQWKASKLPYGTTITGRLPIPEPPDWGIVDDQPMLNVNWDDAEQYVHRAGKRLPTEAEWEKAARGTDRRLYPWGDQPPTFDRAIWDEHPQAKVSTAPVTCCASGASPYGVLNMAGNVMEWCEDTYDPHYYAASPRQNPVARGPGDFRVLRGGAFLLKRSMLRTTDRYRLHQSERLPYIGFRAAVSGVER